MIDNVIGPICMGFAVATTATIVLIIRWMIVTTIRGFATMLKDIRRGQA